MSSANQNRTLRHPSRHRRALSSQSESSITSPESSANQNRAFRHPRALGSCGGPFSALGSSRLATAYLNTWGPPTPAHLSSHSYYWSGQNAHNREKETLEEKVQQTFVELLPKDQNGAN